MANQKGETYDVNIATHLLNFMSSTDNNMMRNFMLSQYDRSFQPDVNGYTFISIVPPMCSSDDFGDANRKFMKETADRFLFLALDATPPETSINTDEQSGQSHSIPYATGKSSGGQLSINFIDNQHLEIHEFHHLWVKYIDRIIIGEYEPGKNKEGKDYVDTGEVDYFGSVYISRFYPSMDEVLYIGKATGIFPLNLPTKEVIGARETNALTTIPMNYNCAYYNQHNLNSPDKYNKWIFDEFKTHIIDKY